MEKEKDILEKASKCLNCKKPMCKKGCPISTDIPSFISKIKEKNFKEAYYILNENNFFSEICSTICPVENQCTGNCIKGIKEKPVQINILEKYINNWAKENNIIYEPKIKEEKGGKVAIIGSGPSGLATAVELRKAGFEVTIFEKEEKCGGILEYGIPDFRLQKEIIKRIIDKILDMGVEIKTEVEFGKDITIRELKEEGYESIFLGMGATSQSTYKLAENKTDQIINSDEFLKLYNKGEKIKNLGTTVVIGGGNVAFDSARTAIKMGADEVYILYRRNKELMPAREIELKEAIQDGVKIHFQTKVVGAKVKEGKIEEIECVKTKIVDNKAVDVENSNYTMKADTVIFAIGAKADEEFFNSMGIHTENGVICVNENYMTNLEGIYAGGDLTQAKSSVAKAIATGKKVAKAIIERKESDK